MLFTLFTSFFQIGLFAFGGGYAVIPLLLQAVLEHSWLTEAEFTNVVAISQMTPGPIAVNLATFVGFKTEGLPGALIATLGVSLPSVILVSAAMLFIARVTNSRLVKSVFHGLRPGAAGLIASSALGMTIFYGIGLGLGATTGLVHAGLTAAGVFLFQVLYSYLWMQRFQYGPLEWVWRMLTYGKRLKLKKQT
jgi:chromate transporter